MTTRELQEQAIGQIRYDHAPSMVRKRHDRHEQGYSVIAASNVSNGDEVGFSGSLKESQRRAEQLRSDPSRWIGNKVQPIAIYNVSDLRIVERYEPPSAGE